MKRGPLTVLLFSVIASALALGQSPNKVAKPKTVDYARDIQPILAAYCFTCHGPDASSQKAGLRLDTAEGATKKLRRGGHAIVPGNVKDSALLARVFSDDETERMPPPETQKTMKPSEKELLKRWIAEGAEYQRHWAFVAPLRPELPKVKNAKWPRQPLDYFTLAAMEKAGLAPSPEADRYTLARRVSLDLTGLPPTIEAVDRFVADKSPDAYDRFVDEVLQSPAFGERWAHVWLDLARYADSRGYATDNARSIWKYRDWVIEALNQNMPFDRFTIEQIAGDLLPEATQKQILATAFHRNTLTNDEGGTSDEEFRVAAVVDRVNTTFAVWMGITMACAQCHDHKYDPISQEEFYRFYAIFNQTADADRGDESPLLTLLTPEEQKQKADLEAAVAKLEKELNRAAPEIDAAFQKWLKDVDVKKAPANIQKILALDAAKRDAKQQAELNKHFRNMAPELKDVREKLEGAKKELKSIKIVTAPIMKELPEKQRRKTKIHIRGNFLDEGKEVTPGLPSVFHPYKGESSLDRLAVARWLVDRSNSLTARVAVNRYWEQIFGVYLVETPEDFGMRSVPPAQQALLDWLAVEFMTPSATPGARSGIRKNSEPPATTGGILANSATGDGATGWDVKRFLKMLATSATYRQSSRVTPELLERDPENRLFARGPRFRTSAETIRDQALFASGLLSSKMYGPSVRPPRPKLGLTAAFGGGTDWDPSPGADKYRRALYTEWRRTTPYPSMLTFDAPNRNVCTVARPRTNTPLQALVTLNDPVYVEAAQALGRRMVKEGGATPESRVAHGFRLCVTRPPEPAETQRLVALYRQARSDFAKNPKDAQQLATDPLGPLPGGMDAVDLAAWTVVGNVLLNLDEVLAKR